MSRKLISGNDIISFTPASGIIVVKGYVPISKLLLINNVTVNTTIFNFSDPTAPATVTYDSEQNITTIDLSYNTSLMSSSDKIQLYYEKDDLEIKPTRTYRDPVSKFRVSTPETLIDTDFEYGPQPTKWETVKLVNNIPTSYSSPFTENSIPLSSVTVSSGSNLMTIESPQASSLSIGGVVEINGLSDSQFEGTFIIKSVSSNTFTVKLSFNSNKNASLATIYSIAYKGAFYTGSAVTVEEVSTSTGAASTITVTTPNIHGFNDRTKLYLKNSRATKKYSFTVPDAVVGVGTTNYKSEILSSDFTNNPAPEYYNNLRVIADDIIGKFEINTPSSSVNTSNGDITYSSSTQQNAASLSGISTGQVLTFYTHVENTTLGKSGSPISNFTPFRVSSVSTSSGITTFRLADSYSSVLEYVPTSAGTVSFGNHRFIRGYRIVQFVYPYTIVFSDEVDFSLNDQLILNTNYTTATYESVTRSYCTKYNGQYNKSSYPYYAYTISSISGDRKTVTVNATLTYFNNVNVQTLYPNNIWSASAVTSHPLSNSLYLPPSSGFSTSVYDDYQYVKYLNPNNATKIPSLTNNTNYILRQTNKRDWYRLTSADNSSDASTNWESPIDLYFNVASNPNNPANTNGTATNVLTVGVHTITSSISFKNSNTISLPNRGGLENNSTVVYNTVVTAIGNLTANNSYKIKTEDTSLSSDRFRLSSSTEFVKLYGFTYSAGSSSATVYVYDTKDRVSADAAASDGLPAAGIVNGNTVQISGSEYVNPIKKQSINRSFKITSTPATQTSTPKDPSSPVGTLKYVYRFNVEIPQDGTFNTNTSISIFAGQTYADSALGSTKCTGIINLNISDPATNGEHTLTQNIDGAIDDIYETINTSSKSFQFNTKTEIPEITKNIASFSSTGESGITLVNSPAYFTLSNNGLTNLQASPNIANSGSWRSTVSNVTYTAPVSVEFRIDTPFSYYSYAGLTETTGTTLSYGSGYAWVQQNYFGSDFGRFVYDPVGGVSYRDSDISSTNVYKIEYGTDGVIRYYKNGTQVSSSNIGTGKTLRVFVGFVDYFYTSSSSNVNNLKIAASSLPFTAGSTNYLKVTSHNFADGTEVTYQTTGAEALLPLVHNQNYFVRVLDGDYIGLTSSFESSVDRTQPTIGFTTTGSSGATNNLKTLSVKGFLNGKGTVAISTSSSLVTGTDTAFLTDFSNGDTFRAYKLGIGTPGQYFEAKISSIKGDKILKLDSIPTFASSAASYFKQTALYAVSDGKVSHRPFDGGVAMYSGLVPNTKIIRQTRKYFRYQSGKGIQVSMAVNFNPTNDIDIISKVGVGATSIYSIKSKFPHKLSSNSVDTEQKIVISSVVSSASTFFNRKTTEIGFPIQSIVDDNNFTIDIGNSINVDDLAGFPKYVVKNWRDSSLRAGLFDDQNGFYLECDGSTLYAVRRSSTQQLSGQFYVQRNSYVIQGIDSILTKQVSPNDYIVIRGQTYKVTSVLSDTALNIQPAYRGNTSSNVVISKVINTRVPQSEWNIDRMDGTGESGYDIDISKIQMIYMDYSWYGAGSVRFGFKDQIGEVKYCHEFVHNNVFTESYFRSGNLPARYEVETYDDPLYSPALSHWGVSVIMDGRFDSDKAYLFTADSETLTFSGDGQSSTFTGAVTAGSTNMSGIDSTEFQSLVVGQTILPTSTYVSYLSSDTKISAINIDRIGNAFFGGQPSYKITMSKPALLGSPTSITFNTGAGNAVDIQSLIPLVSIRLSPSVDNSNIGSLGFRDIINRMQLTLKSAGVLTTHDCEVRLILNGKLSDESFNGVTSPSLSQVYKHLIGDKITEGITVYSFRARGGTPINTTTGRKNLNGTDVSLDELALLGNSILGGDGTFPDGPDVLTLAVKPLEPSSINGGSPLVVSARITWTEAQA